LLGSLVRPIGGRLADRLGGARVTLWTFVAMALAAGIVLTASRQHSLPLFLTGFTTLFVLSGVGNGSTYKMIPAIFRVRTAVRLTGDAADREARRLSAALIGLAGAIGAFGGVLVNVAFRQSFLATRTGDGAYIAFIAFYVICCAVTWSVYRRGSSLRGV
jgi:NNP family nitrate/nitrite transporter-like MFS transporter